MSETPLSVTPIISYPREAQVGKTYLMTVDLQFSGEWNYEEEEYPIYCMLETAPLFSSQPVGEPAIILHRFGGSYGEAKFLLTAAQQEREGNIKVTLVNGWGVPVSVLVLEDLKISLDAELTPLRTRGRKTLLRKAELTEKLNRLEHFSSGKLPKNIRERALKLADGNPRLLEFLNNEVLGRKDVEAKLTELEQSPEQWKDQIIWEELYQLIDEPLQQVLSHCLIEEIQEKQKPIRDLRKVTQEDNLENIQVYEFGHTYIGEENQLTDCYCTIDGWRTYEKEGVTWYPAASVIDFPSNIPIKKNQFVLGVDIENASKLEREGWSRLDFINKYNLVWLTKNFIALTQEDRQMIKNIRNIGRSNLHW